MIFRLVSYNIHKGLSYHGLDFVLYQLKSAIKDLGAHVLCAQEVVGYHKSDKLKIKNNQNNSQFEYLADQVWPHYSYGQNAVYDEGHHGNAILSQFPLRYSHNLILANNWLESRGCLHAVVDVPGSHQSLHILTLHLSLFGQERSRQLDLVFDYITKNISPASPIILSGDFNDWNMALHKKIELNGHVKEVFHFLGLKLAKTFPQFHPIFSLDRVYCRNIEVVSANCPNDMVWKKLSDHLPIVVDFKI